MKNKYILISIFAGIIVLTAIFLSVNNTSTKTAVEGWQSEVEKVVLHKSPTCGCCNVYGEYLKKLGFEIETHDTDDLNAVKERFEIPREIESCHTTEFGGYIVEGHIPEEAIQKLITEKPDIKGIGMAGMPSGSPGMPGPKTSDFVIYEINHDGTLGEVFLTL